MTLLKVNNLSVVYQTSQGRVPAVSGISFSLERGKTLGFVGESGCGKSTLGMAVMGLLPRHAAVTGGDILFEGRSLLNLTPRELREIRWSRIAMIFQAAMNALNPVHRVGDQVAEAILAHSKNITKAEAMRQVRDLFGQVGLPGSRAREYPHQFSGGMKQRAVIAMALACRPALIIADEPTTALDVILQDQILKTLKDLQQKLDLSILFISHDTAVVADVCHTIGVMVAGRLIEIGSREEVLSAPIHPYTRRLTSAYQALMDEQENPNLSINSTGPAIAARKGCLFSNRCLDAVDTCRSIQPEWIDISPTHRVCCPVHGKAMVPK